MSLTTAGARLISKALTGLNSPTLLNSTNAALGVGDGGGTAFAIGQTDLQGTNKSRKQVTSVVESTGVITLSSTWGTAEGNGYAWSEWGVFNSGTASSGGDMVGRKVESPDLGAKTSAQVWVLQATATVSAS